MLRHVGRIFQKTTKFNLEFKMQRIPSSPAFLWVPGRKLKAAVQAVKCNVIPTTKNFNAFVSFQLLTNLLCSFCVTQYVAILGSCGGVFQVFNLWSFGTVDRDRHLCIKCSTNRNKSLQEKHIWSYENLKYQFSLKQTQWAFKEKITQFFLFSS